MTGNVTPLRSLSGRVPPNDLEAEAAVLSAILLDRDALDKVLEILKAQHFYSEAHRRIYEVAVDLSSRGKPIDIVSVAGQLRDRERLTQIGGSAYLAELADAVPSVAHIETYAKMVREKSRVRELIAVCQKIAAEGYGDVGEVQAFIDGAEQSVYEIARSPEATNMQHIEPVIRSVFGQIVELAKRGERITGIPTGFERLDGKTAGLHDGELTIIAARPGMGKTSFALNIAVNVAAPKSRTIQSQDPHGSAETEEEPGTGVAVFSLEMPREQLASRLVCAEGRVEVSKMRQGFLQDRDWGNLTQAASFLYQLPIWIDDTPAIGVLELRAKVRRLQAEYNRTAADGSLLKRVGLVVVDYLQLMSGSQRASSREQEVSEISRGLKQISKELHLPVIALSQLNRAVETRGTKDKRPQLSDLRECIAGEEVVMDAMTGELVTVREIAAGRQTLVYGLRKDWRLAAAPVARAWSTGVKPVFLLTTQSGRRLRATASHPLRAIDGWKPLESLARGERIAVPRVLHEPFDPRDSLTPDELRLLGYLISDGHYGKHRTVSYVKADPTLCQDVRDICLRRFGIVAKPHRCEGVAEQFELTADGSGPGSNPLINWLKDMDIHGQVGTTKRVPREVFRQNDRALGVFLGALWGGDGSIVPRRNGGYVLKFTNTSMGLLDDVQWILSRLGIVASRGEAERNTKSKVDISTIVVGEADAILRFGTVVPMSGIKGRKLAEACRVVEAMGRNARIDRLPLVVTDHVAKLKEAAGMSWSELGYRAQGKEMCRTALERVARRLLDRDLGDLAASDVLWDEVDRIEPAGEAETFDLSVPGLNNFVVSNMFAHNSGAIEQDADNIIFIYREDYYFQEEETVKGIAELILAKQRNGPTGKVKVRWDASFTRFDNLAPGECPEDFDD